MKDQNGRSIDPAASHSRRDVIIGGAALAGANAAPFPVQAVSTQQPPRLAGVNIAGAEFGKIPGKLGTDYTYPDRNQLDAFAKLNFNVVRIPFSWERLQPQLLGDFSVAELNQLSTVVANCHGLGLHVILDLHNYARRRLARDDWKIEHLIGSAEVSSTAFDNVWQKLARVFGKHAHVIFGLMNEPFGMPAETWLALANSSLVAIRSSEATNLVLVPGVAYTGAHSWIASGNTALERIVDPGKNYAIEVHQYFDEDSSGNSPDAMSQSVGSDRVAAFEDWARSVGVRAFLGEFAAGDNPKALAALDNLLERMEKNPDVWMGWSAWAAGAWWPPDYMFKLDAKQDGTLPRQTEKLAAFARRLAKSG